MSMDLVLYGTLGLEVVGLIIGLLATIKALIHFYYSKKYYKEYSTETGLKQLIFDMKIDGIYKEDEEVDVDRLLFSMELQLADAKFKVWKCIIATLIIIPFLIKTLTFI